MPLQFTFKTIDRYEPDEWMLGLPAISDESRLEQVKRAFDSGKILVVEHWHYRGARAPDRFVFDDFEMYEDYLRANGKAGDSIHIFDITSALKIENQLVHGKCPNELGETPRKGAY